MTRATAKEVTVKAITPRQVQTVGKGRHRVQGTPGLFVLVKASGARAWVYRGWDGTREIVRGLGAVIDVSLTEARNAATRLRAGIIDGTDLPRAARTVRRAAVHTWQEAFDRLRQNKAQTARESTLRATDSVWRVHVAPTLGARDVARTDRETVITMIAGIKGSSANKARKLTREVGALAVSLGWIAANPAGAEINVALPVAAKRTTEGRRKAMPFTEIAGWLAALTGPTANVIRVLVLTVARLADVLGAEWSEFDGDTWTIPGSRHKSGQDFRVPLTAPVRAILEAQRGLDERFVFPSLRGAGHISDETVRKAMHADYTLHGFRAAFSTWAAETNRDRDVAETALAHAVGNAVQRAYQRSDLFDRRAALLAEWAAYVTRSAASR